MRLITIDDSTVIIRILDISHRRDEITRPWLGLALNLHNGKRTYSILEREKNAKWASIDVVTVCDEWW